MKFTAVDWLVSLCPYPLATAAWLIANSSFITQNRIYWTFPNKCGLGLKLVNLSDKAERFANTKTCSAGHLGDISPNLISKPKTKYERASSLAIAELGSGADRKKLLMRADEILNTH